MKVRIMSLLGYIRVKRVIAERMVKKVYKWNLINMKSKGRPIIRCQNDTVNDLKVMKVKNWIGFQQTELVGKAKFN